MPRWTLGPHRPATDSSCPVQNLCHNRRVAKATGASIVMTLADMEGNETFDASALGSADEVVEESVADNDMLMIRGPKNTRAVTGAAALGLCAACVGEERGCSWCGAAQHTSGTGVWG